MNLVNIGNNQFEDIPQCLFHLRNLETLLCYNNRLKFINLGLLCKYKNKNPIEISYTFFFQDYCENIKVLNLNNNQIAQLPPEIGR